MPVCWWCLSLLLFGGRVDGPALVLRYATPSLSLSLTLTRANAPWSNLPGRLTLA